MGKNPKLKPGYVWAPYVTKMLSPEEMAASRKKFRETKEANGLMTAAKFDEIHQACPTCGSIHYSMTLVGVMEVIDKDYCDNINSVRCVVCDWSGTPFDLVKKDDTKP